MSRGARPARVQYLDALRVLSMLAVVFLHTVAGTLRANYGSPQWHFSNGLSALATASVPLFFMISGALLLSSPHTSSVGYTLRRRVPRVLVPFLLWSFIAVAYYLAVSRWVAGTPDWTAAVDRLKNLPAQPTAIHLWFMYALIPLYILSPFIKKMVDSLDRNLAIYLVCLWLFFSALLPTVTAFLPESYRPILTLDRRYDLSVMAGYAGYFVAGYYLMRLQKPVSKRWLGVVVIVDVVCITLGTWWKTASAGQYREIFKSYSGLFVVVLSCALFLLVKELLRERRLGRIGAAITGVLAPLAFGVYLIHNLLVDLFSRLVQWWPAPSVQIVVVSYLAVLAASIAAVFVMSRIKPLCYALIGQVYRPWFGGRRTGERDATRAADPATDQPTQDVPTVEIVLPKVWRPEPAKVKPPQPPSDTAERPGREKATGGEGESGNA